VVLENGRSTKVNQDHLRQEVAEYIDKCNHELSQREALWADKRAYMERMVAAVEAAEGAPEGVVEPGR